jgi:hypothetical protein
MKRDGGDVSANAVAAYISGFCLSAKREFGAFGCVNLIRLRSISSLDAEDCSSCEIFRYRYMSGCCFLFP